MTTTLLPSSLKVGYPVVKERVRNGDLGKEQDLLDSGRLVDEDQVRSVKLGE